MVNIFRHNGDIFRLPIILSQRKFVVNNKIFWNFNLLYANWW